ncbi:MAG TPA: LuxR C-terminal-related transcriptional regulator, partial [Anaerolineales bacterium]
LGSSLDTEIVRVWLALQNAGTSSPAEPLAERSGLILASWRRELGDDAGHPGQSPDQSTEMARLTLARVCIASGQTQEALRLLRHAAQSAQAKGHVELGIHCLVQTAMALQGDAAQSAAALAAIGEALNLAGPGGYMRIFLDEGPPMRKLLARWQARAEPGFVRDYAACLLAQFDAETHEAGVNSAAGSPTGSLIEPLSRRELEVLQLMALGSTNQQIAGQLVVAAGTVKAHTASIYRKLEVANRTEAVARARQLGILV